MAIIEAQKRSKPSRKTAEKEPVNLVEAKTILHISEPIDYQGRSFLEPPRDVGINFHSPSPPDKCFLPKKHLHTWEGHSRRACLLSDCSLAQLISSSLAVWILRLNFGRCQREEVCPDVHWPWGFNTGHLLLLRWDKVPERFLR